MAAMSFFVTVAEPPAVTTVGANQQTGTSAVVTGNLTEMGTAATVATSFKYGPTTSYGSTVTGLPATMTSPGVFTGTITGLTPGTTYHFRAEGNGGLSGTATGGDMTFTTLTPPTPDYRQRIRRWYQLRDSERRPILPRPSGRASQRLF